MRRARPRANREPTIALINIVFLMLIFFMVAGTLAPPLAPEVRLIDTHLLQGSPAPDALVITADGTLLYRGEPLDSAEDYVATLTGETLVARLVPDRALPATALVAIASDMRRAGAARVMIVTERGVK